MRGTRLIVFLLVGVEAKALGLVGEFDGGLVDWPCFVLWFLGDEGGRRHLYRFGSNEGQLEWLAEVI